MKQTSFMLVLCAVMQAQTKQTWKAPRTPDGHPDIHGFWVNNMATPLERPRELSGHPVLTDDELAAMKKKANELFHGEGDAAFGDSVFVATWANIKGLRSGFTSAGGDTGDYSSVWTVERVWDNRTSLVTTPEGRIPPQTPEGQKRAAENLAGTRRPAEGPEDRSLSERCITYGVPSLVEGYQSGYEIVQSANAIAIETEMIHDTRVLPLNGGSHVPPAVRNWKGDSRAHWEGETLVVDTTNYKQRAFMRISSEQLHITERFIRTNPEELQYEVTVDDPGTWTKSWSLMIPLKRTTGPLYEYACHEGNRGLLGILTGARGDEALRK